MEGKIIVIEGGDGSGKTVQTELLVDCLKQDGIDVVTLDFPQYDRTVGGKLVRQYLDGTFGDPATLDPRLSCMFYAMDRYQCADEIWRWLSQGKIIVLNRYMTANIIHQGGKMSLGKTDHEAFLDLLAISNFIHELEFKILNIPVPDLVLYLHVDPEIAQTLMTQQGRKKDGLESAPLAYQKSVVRTALLACNQFPRTWQLIDCTPENEILSKETIHELIWQKVENFLRKEK